MLEPLNLPDSALILLDFQRGVLERPPGAGIPAAATAAAEAAGRVAHAFRERALPVVVVGVERRRDYADVAAHGTDFGDAQQSAIWAAERRLIEGTPDVEFASEIQVRAADYRVTKRRVSAFFGTPLEIYLRRLAIRSLVVCGVFTDMGVETTVRDAYDRDFEIVVVSDACWSGSAVAHQHAIGHTFPRLARVRSADEVVQQLAVVTAVPGQA